jgi:pyrroloquinoline quinone biosynthesis protein B
MIIKVLGSAAGGGFPQWNCNCRNCADVRAGKPGFAARTQSSLAVSLNGREWVLLNASPDLRQQINMTRELGARLDGPLRNSPIKAVVLTNGDVDHISGLINLREMEPLSIYGSNRVLATLAANSIFNILSPSVVYRHELVLDQRTEIHAAEGSLGLGVTAFDVPGKVALYLEDASQGPGFGTQKGDTIGLEVADPETGKRFYYIPGCADVDAALAERIEGAALVFLDGTLYADDEMIVQGLLNKTGARMGHISISGEKGSIAALRDLGIARKVYVHINNSNPILDELSAEHAAVRAAGWEVGYDGLEVRL